MNSIHESIAVELRRKDVVKMYVYKTVPAPTILGVKNEKQINDAIRNFANYINQECVDGWEFYSMETITTQTPQGCLGLGGSKITTYNMLVFRRAI